MGDQALAVASDPRFIAVAVLAVTCLGLSKGGLVGFGLVATPLLALVLPPVQAVAILLPIMILQDVISVWAYRRHWDRRNLLVTVPGAAIGVGAAWLFAASLSDAHVRLAVGLIALAFALNHWFARPRLRAEATPTVLQGIFWGGISGFTGTLANAGGPPFLVHLLPQRLDKLTFVGTMAIYFAALNAIKILPFLALGQFSAENLIVSAMLAPLAIVTNLVGIWVVRKLPNDVFYAGAYVLVALVSLALIWQGSTGLLHR
jgi:uncharacterized protein